MSGAQPTDQEIFDTLKKSGYLMEQEVATAIESLGFHVETNRAYKDLDEQKSREMDVWAHKNILRNETTKTSLSIELICECKNNSNPFVFIGRPKNDKDKNIIKPKEYLFPIETYEQTLSQSTDGKTRSYKNVPAFQYLNLTDHHYYYKLDTKAVQFCKIVRNGKNWEANHGGIYEGIFYPIVKAFLSRREEVITLHPHQPKSDDWKYISLFFPMVVLYGDIYYLDSVTAIQPNQVQYVTFVREIKSRTIDGQFAIDFVKMDALADFIKHQVFPFAQRIVEIVQSTPEVFLTKQIT